MKKILFTSLLLLWNTVDNKASYLNKEIRIYNGSYKSESGTLPWFPTFSSITIFAEYNGSSFTGYSYARASAVSVHATASNTYEYSYELIAHPNDGAGTGTPDDWRLEVLDEGVASININ